MTEPSRRAKELKRRIAANHDTDDAADYKLIQAAFRKKYTEGRLKGLEQAAKWLDQVGEYGRADAIRRLK